MGHIQRTGNIFSLHSTDFLCQNTGCISDAVKKQIVYPLSQSLICPENRCGSGVHGEDTVTRHHVHYNSFAPLCKAFSEI